MNALQDAIETLPHPVCLADSTYRVLYVNTPCETLVEVGQHLECVPANLNSDSLFVAHGFASVTLCLDSEPCRCIAVPFKSPIDANVSMAFLVTEVGSGTAAASPVHISGGDSIAIWYFRNNRLVIWPQSWRWATLVTGRKKVTEGVTIAEFTRAVSRRSRKNLLEWIRAEGKSCPITLHGENGVEHITVNGRVFRHDGKLRGRGVATMVTDHTTAQKKQFLNADMINRLVTVSTVAHELNQPIVAIQNYAKAAERYVLRSVQTSGGSSLNGDSLKLLECVKNIQCQIDGVADLRQKMAATKVSVGRTMIALGQLVRERISVFCHLSEAGKYIDLVDSGRECLVHGCEVQLTVLIDNILGNAVTHGFNDSDEGSVRVVLESRDKHVSMSVTSPGFWPGTGGKQVGSSSGFGFGLMICEQIAANHDAEFVVDLNENGGSCVSVQFSRIRENQSEVGVV